MSSMVPRFLSHLPSSVIVHCCSPCKCSTCAKEGILQDWKYFSWFVKSVSAMSNKALSLKSLMSVALSYKSWKNLSYAILNLRIREKPETNSGFVLYMLSIWKTDTVLWHFCCTHIPHPTCMIVFGLALCECYYVSVYLLVVAWQRLYFSLLAASGRNPVNAIIHSFYCMLVI